MIFSIQSILTLASLLGFNVHVVTDTIKPSIRLINPVELTQILPGGALKMSAVLSDNIALEDYQINITKGGTDALCYVKSFSCNHLINASVDAEGNPLPKIKGKLNARLDIDIGVSKDALIGDYDFSIHVKDEAGNEQIKKVNFMVARF